jgi:uncharacterized membrane protein (DUF2068 family)
MKVGTAVPPKRAPTYYGIIVFKLLKGALFVTLAITAYALSDNNLPVEYQKLLHWLRLNPERKFFSEVAAQVAKLTRPVLWVGAGSMLYSLFSLVEGVGLMFAGWAGWLAIGESLFIQLRFTNSGIFMDGFCNSGAQHHYCRALYQNRERLFRRHYHHQRHGD